MDKEAGLEAIHASLCLRTGFALAAAAQSPWAVVGAASLTCASPGCCCRWEAAQTLARKLMLELVGKAQKGENLQLAPAFVAALKNVLMDPALDKVRT